MEEEDAREKTCPLMGCQCRASDCMAWGWDPIEYEEGTPLPLGTSPSDPEWIQAGETWCAGGDYGTGSKRMRWRRPKPKTGHCTAFGDRH
jgi:hypothetical protein